MRGLQLRRVVLAYPVWSWSGFEANPSYDNREDWLLSLCFQEVLLALVSWLNWLLIIFVEIIGHLFEALEILEQCMLWFVLHKLDVLLLDSQVLKELLRLLNLLLSGWDVFSHFHLGLIFHVLTSCVYDDHTDDFSHCVIEAWLDKWVAFIESAPLNRVADLKLKIRIITSQLS